jgi:uncharacterized membrane protein
MGGLVIGGGGALWAGEVTGAVVVGGVVAGVVGGAVAGVVAGVGAASRTATSHLPPLSTTFRPLVSPGRVSAT